jgi:hypothetical protein
METVGNGHVADNVDPSSGSASAAAADKGKGDRRTVRGVPDEIWDRLLKGMAITGGSQGQWIADAITLKFSEDLKRSRLPARTGHDEPPVTALMPIDEAAEPAALVHLEVLRAIQSFALPPHSLDVRRMADRVIIDRCKQLLEGRPPPRLSKSEPAQLTGDIPSGDETA